LYWVGLDVHQRRTSICILDEHGKKFKESVVIGGWIVCWRKLATFGRNKQVGAYFGLVPCQDASADVNRLGRITRQGPATVRRLLVEAAWQGIGLTTACS
jgi:hypothetical protein